MPVPLKYYGAHTGRYSGDSRINLQNLPKRVEGIAGDVPSLLKAAEGKTLVGADASQIEARILAGIAEQDELVGAFRDGQDVYSEFAAHVFGEEVRKPDDSDSPEAAVRMKALRHIGKRSILGLGYAMGASTFEDKIKPSSSYCPPDAFCVTRRQASPRVGDLSTTGAKSYGVAS